MKLSKFIQYPPSLDSRIQYDNILGTIEFDYSNYTRWCSM